MKKNLTKPVIAVLLGALTFSSCIGSFGLTNSVLDWNKRATDNKFVNEIIFVLISPASDHSRHQPKNLCYLHS